jgi:hypothetical protein
LAFGWVSAVESEGRTIWIADAHRGGGKRFVRVHNEPLSVGAMGVSVVVATGAQQGRQTFGGSLHQKSLLMGQRPFHQFRNIALIRPQSVLRIETIHPRDLAKV